MNEISQKLRSYVQSRGGPALKGGAWELMLEAADEIDRMQTRVDAWREKGADLNQQIESFKQLLAKIDSGE